MEEKKESWIEQLIKLLNEYYKIKNYAPIEFYDNENDGFDTDYMAYYKTALIISKKFWFIKRLVENDKINRDEFIRVMWVPLYAHFDNWEIISTLEPSDDDQLIMYLSITSNPIDALIGLLK